MGSQIGFKGGVNVNFQDRQGIDDLQVFFSKFTQLLVSLVFKCNK